MLSAQTPDPSPSPSTGSTRYQILDPMRGLAALWVFLFHHQFCDGFQHWFPYLHQFLKVGDRGVSMFFVISGFCLGLASAHAIAHQDSVGQFLYRRAKRIYPAFWCAALLICLIRFAAWGVTSCCQISTNHAIPPGFTAYNWVDWLKVISLTQIFDPNTGIWYVRFGAVNGAFWTLAIEFQFYLVVALTVWLPRWRIWILGGVTLLSLPAYFWAQAFWPCVDYGLFLPFWARFACGLGLYGLLARGIVPSKVFGRRWAAVSLLGIVALFTVFAVLVRKNVELEWTAFSFGFTLLLWFAVDFDEFIGDLLHGKRWLPANCGKAILALGTMSYSLYLVHNEFSHFVVRTFQLFSINHRTVTDLIVIGVTVCAAYPFYCLCEKPFLSSGRKAAPQMKVAHSLPAPHFLPVIPRMSEANYSGPSIEKTENRCI